MLAAVKAKGITIINNAAIEPEIADVGNFGPYGNYRRSWNTYNKNYWSETPVFY